MSSARSSSLESTNVKRKRKEVAEEELLDSDSDSDDNVQPSDTPEEPVLSHAERRRRKKEQKLAANLKEDSEEGGSATKKRKLKDGSAKEVVPLKRQNSVWIGNLSFKTTLENLRTFLGDVGEITRINMPTKRAAGPGLKPENRGYVHRRPLSVCKQTSESYSLDLHMWILRLRKRRHWPLLYQKVPL
jgi:RNA recognition motif-containing protein